MHIRPHKVTDNSLPDDCPNLSLLLHYTRDEHLNIYEFLFSLSTFVGDLEQSKTLPVKGKEHCLLPCDTLQHCDGSNYMVIK
jgi:hypothetical protein